MSNLQVCYYTKDHEWIRIESVPADGIGVLATIGITNFAQGELGDLVYIDLPKTGSNLVAGKSFCVVESTKAASDVYAPLDATVVKVNEALTPQPDLVNKSPEADGWLCQVRIKNEEPLTKLLSAEQYQAFLSGSNT